MIGQQFPFPALVAGLPLLAGVAAVVLPGPRLGAWLTIGASSATFTLACLLPWHMRTDALLLVDPLSAHAALIVSFVAMTSAWSDRHRRIAPPFEANRQRAQHGLFLALLGSLLLTMFANNLGIGWIALEIALLAAVTGVGTGDSVRAVAAAVRFLLMGGVGAAFILFGYILLYFVGLSAVGPGVAAMSWRTLSDLAPTVPPGLLAIAFVFLLTGYGTFAALAPLHLWLPDAMATAPRPFAAMLVGALPMTATVALLRGHALLAVNGTALGGAIRALGLLSVLLAAFGLWRQREPLRCLAWVTIAQLGVAAVAFSLGGGAARAAGLLHVTFLALAATAAVASVGPAPHGGTQAAVILALACLPPFGLFASLFLIFNEIVQQAPLSAVLLGLGLAVGITGLTWRLNWPTPRPQRSRAIWPALVPAWVSLALLAAIGLAMPAMSQAWFSAVTRALP